jgi:enterochelin esterase-like enzyme
MIAAGESPHEPVLPAEAGLTRRGFLIAVGLTAGAVVAGGAAVDRIGPWRHWTASVRGDLGDAGLFHGLTGTTVRRFELHSKFVDDPVPWAIAWPPGKKPGDPLPVCFALPGRGGVPPMGFADDVARAIKRGATRPYALVGVHGGVSYWHKRASGEDRLAMLLDEILPMCRDKYHLGDHGRKRALIGWSMGGYGALLAAETRPDQFAAVCGVGPAVWTSYDAMMLGPRDAFDSAADFAAHDVIAHADRLRTVRVRIDCGTSDPFYGYVSHLTAALPGHWSGGFGNGGHDHAYWSTLAAAEAKFIGRALA